MFSGVMYSCTALFFAQGLVMLAGAVYRYRIPIVILVAFGLCRLYFLVINDDGVWRLYCLQAAIVLVFLHAAVIARGLMAGPIAEKVTYGTFVAFAVTSLPRTWLVVNREPDTYGFDSSPYWLATTTTIYAFALILGLALIITIMQRRVAMEQELSETDSLTGLNNRRGFALHAQKLLARPATYAVLVLDLDYFKRINDSYGHSRGDQVLEQVARVIEQVIPAGALPARLGGEEFVVLLANSSFGAAERLAYDIGSSIAASSFGDETLNLKCTVSTGFGVFSQEVPVKTAVQMVDVLLYRAKSGGRNQVVGRDFTCSKDTRDGNLREAAWHDNAGLFE